MSDTDLRDDPELMKVLGVLTGDLLPVRQTTTTIVKGQPIIVKGRYFLNEDDLTKELKALLHGRAFVVDKDSVSQVSAFSPKTYYVSADKSNGLIVPGRSMAIGTETGAAYVSGNAHFRWTDNGEHWTKWVTMPIGKTFSFLPDEQVRFAEVQIYTDSGNIEASLIVTR